MFFFHFRALFINKNECGKEHNSKRGNSRSGLKSGCREHEFSSVIALAGIERDERVLIYHVISLLAVDIKLPAILFRDGRNDDVVFSSTLDVELGKAVRYDISNDL